MARFYLFLFLKINNVKFIMSMGRAVTPNAWAAHSPVTHAMNVVTTLSRWPLELPLPGILGGQKQEIRNPIKFQRARGLPPFLQHKTRNQNFPRVAEETKRLKDQECGQCTLHPPHMNKPSAYG